MPAAAGTYRVGPQQGSLRVNTYREGMAAKAGHDLVLEVARWEGVVEIADDVDRSRIELHADPRSLEVRDALRGVKPLSAGDRADIARNIDGKILRGQPIAFRSTAIRTEGEDALAVEGELTLAGTTRPLTMQLAVVGDDRVAGTVALTQSDWGIKPYRGLMGALKVRDQVEITVEARLAGP
jgi:polyisoprenoid-binding protein YceI